MRSPPLLWDIGAKHLQTSVNKWARTSKALLDRLSNQTFSQEQEHHRYLEMNATKIKRDRQPKQPPSQHPQN